MKDYVKLATLLLSLVVFIIKEYFSESAKKEKADKKYRLDQKEFNRLVIKSMRQFQDAIKNDSSDIAKIDDIMDIESDLPKEFGNDND